MHVVICVYHDRQRQRYGKLDSPQSQGLNITPAYKRSGTGMPETGQASEHNLKPKAD